MGRVAHVGFVKWAEGLRCWVVIYGDNGSLGGKGRRHLLYSTAIQHGSPFSNVAPT